MKKKIILVLLIVAMLLSLCGCDLQNAELAITEYRLNWFSDLENSVIDLRANWFSNLQSGVEDKVSYSLTDLKRETSNFVAFDFENEKVAYFDDFVDALADPEVEYITIQLSFDITEDISIPAGKTVFVDTGVILGVVPSASLTIESGGCLIFNGISYLLLNDLAICNIQDGGALSVGETSSIISTSEDAITYTEDAIFTVKGMWQMGTVFNVYSDVALDLAIRSAVDGAVINIVQDLGSESSYRIYDINKSISIVGATLSLEDESSRSVAVYGGFIVSSDSVSISGIEVYPPTTSSTVSYPISINKSYAMDACITVAATDVSITKCTFNSSESINNGIEIYPFYDEEGTQSYTISSNTFVGFGDLSDVSLSPILIRTNSNDVVWLGKTELSCDFAISESSQTTIASNNTFEDCDIRMAILDCSDGEEVISVFVAGFDISEDYTFEGNYYITGDCNITGANLIVESDAILTIASGVTFFMDADSTMTIQDGGGVVLQSGSYFETYGAVSGSISGSGKFTDWPNYIEITIMVEGEDGVWSKDTMYGQYVGYTAAALEAVYRADKLLSGADYFVGYEIAFALEAGGNVVDDSYAFTADTNVYVEFTGVTIPIYYDDNGGSDIGENRSDLTYPRILYLENAETRKTADYFGGWKIVGGKYDGYYISVITDVFMLDLLNAGYTSLSLQAQWLDMDSVSGYSYVYYLDGGSQFDAHCDVYVYTPAGLNVTDDDDEEYSYEDGEVGLYRVEDGGSYNSQAYIYFYIEAGYEIESVTIIENPTSTTGTYVDVTNQAIVSYDNNMPLVYDCKMSISVEVVTRKITGTVQEITTVGLNSTNGLSIITDLEGYTFNVGDTIKFSARTAKNEIVSTFYVVATWTDDDGDSEVVTYYNTQSVEVDDDYEGGSVSFKIYAIDGRSVFADDFSFDFEFEINED